MLRDDVAQYTKLTGEDGWHVPIMKVGAFLDGYDKGLEVLDKIRAEMEELKPNNPNFKGYFEQNVALNKALEIIDKYKAESEG